MTDASELAKALAATRTRATAVCEVCGREWQALVRPQQPARTCSNRCRQQLHRDRRKLEQAAAPAE